MDHVIVQHTHATTGYGSHGEFLVSRDAQFAHQKDVQGCAERMRDFITDRHAAARQGQYDNVG